MVEQTSKSITKSIVWGYVNLEGNVSTMAVLMARVMDNITLVGPLTYELSHGPFPSEGSHGIKGNAKLHLQHHSTSSYCVLQESVAMHIANKQKMQNRSSQTH